MNNKDTSLPLKHMEEIMIAARRLEKENLDYTTFTNRADHCRMGMIVCIVFFFAGFFDPAEALREFLFGFAGLGALICWIYSTGGKERFEKLCSLCEYLNSELYHTGVKLEFGASDVAAYLLDHEGKIQGVSISPHLPSNYH